jgi:hypothetical protein
MLRSWSTSFVRAGVLAALAVALVASATAPKVHDVDKKLGFRADFDQTWTAVIEVFAERNWAIANMEKDSGLVTTDWMTLDRESPFADCGGAGISGVQRREVRFNVFVRDADDGTVVTVNTTFRELRAWDNKEWYVDCTSTGRVESLIHDLLADVLASQQPRRRNPPPPDAPPPPVAPSPDAAPADGTEGGACYGNQTCNAGLACDDITGRCVRAAP